VSLTWSGLPWVLEWSEEFLPGLQALGSVCSACCVVLGAHTSSMGLRFHLSVGMMSGPERADFGGDGRAQVGPSVQARVLISHVSVTNSLGCLKPLSDKVTLTFSGALNL
jgi:hypothetical protein